MREHLYHGRCACGAARFEVRGEPLQVSWCHCKDCRRQTGAPAVVWSGFPIGAVRWFSPPRARSSSPNVLRRFCPTCGTPISYEDARLPDEIYLLAGLFDEAGALQPDRHAYVDSKLFWLHVEDGLERCEGESRARWTAA